MIKSTLLTIMLIGILVPGMILSMPGISIYGSHFYSNTNTKIMQQVFAQYDEYRYDDKKKNFAEIERFDDKLFVCENGIVVDDRTQCPLKCPFGTTFEGVYVMNLEICDIEPGTASQKCPQDTDLAGVLVTSKNQCNIFEECDADSPLGLSLGGLELIKVTDVQLCQLSAPDIEICDSGFFEGFAVDNQQTCNTPLDNVDICGPTSDLPGMLTTNPTSCNIFTICDANSPLGESLGNTPVDVVDPELCNLEIPEQTELFICDLDTPMGGAIVTDEKLCQAPNDNNKCPQDTDLEGVYVMDVLSDCNIFATCDAGTALGKALGMENEFKVADEVLCDLEIPQETELFQCIGGPMQDAIVTDLLLCQAPNDANKCADDTDLPGVYVMDVLSDCNIFATCDAGTPLGKALGMENEFKVADEELCNLEIPEQIDLFQCIGGPMIDAIVTDAQLCQAPNDANKCADDTDLPGVYVMDTETQCDLDIPETIECPEGTLLAGEVVTSETLCNVSEGITCPDSGFIVDNLENCPQIDSQLFTCPESGFIVTDQANCPQKCVDGTYLMQGMECPSKVTVTKNWFVCDNNDIIDCTIEPQQQEGEQISFEEQNSALYTQCTSGTDCPFVADAGFEITVDGSNPIPDTFAALINTMQDVELEVGEYAVSELLSIEQIVEDGIINVDDVGVGTSPRALAFDSEGQRVFVANLDSASVSIIELDNNNMVTNVGVGLSPLALAFDSEGQRVFVANGNSASVSIIELDNNNMVTNVGVGTTPRALAFDSEGQRVFVANSFSNSVSIIELDNNNMVTNVGVGTTPTALAFDSEGQRVFVANINSASVSIIELDNNNMVTNVGVGLSPLALAFDSEGQRVFVANSLSNSVSIIELDNNNMVTNVGLGLSPRALAFDSEGQRVFTANSVSASVSIIELDNNNMVTNVGVGLSPRALAFDSEGQRVFTANSVSASVSIIELDNNNMVTNVDVGLSPRALAFDSEGQRVFTANFFSASVSIIDLPSVSKICQDSGFDTGDIRTFDSGTETLQQITCVNFSEQCTGNIVESNTETQCTVDNYAVQLLEIP